MEARQLITACSFLLWVATILSVPCSLNGSAALAQQWDKYIPGQQRKDVFKKHVRLASAGTGYASVAIWITDAEARGMVSEAIDNERLTNEEAEIKYYQLRREHSCSFLIYAYATTATLPPLASAGSVSNPIAPNESFLQREEDKTKFSKGELSDHQFDILLSGQMLPDILKSSYVVNFSRNDRKGNALIQSLSDNMRLQLKVAGKTVILEYKIKGLVTRLEDL